MSNIYKDVRDTIIEEAEQKNIAEITFLREENKRLQEKLKNKHIQTIQDIFKDIKYKLFTIDYKYISKPKCSHCDSDRMLYLNTPTNNKVIVPCDCVSYYKKYIVVIKTLITLHGSLQKYPDENCFLSMVYSYSNGKIFSLNICNNKLSTFKKFEDVPDKNEFLNIMYTTLEEAKKHCTYLNKNNI